MTREQNLNTLVQKRHSAMTQEGREVLLGVGRTEWAGGGAPSQRQRESGMGEELRKGTREGAIFGV